MKVLSCPLLLLAMMFVLPDVTLAEFSIKESPSEHIDISWNSRPLFRLMTAYDTSTKEREHETYKVYAHVIDPLDPDAKRFITKGPGGGYTHHRGIFIGWSKLKVGEQSADMWHMKDKARQLYRKIIQQEATGQSATLTVAIDWVWGDEILLSEKRTFTVYPPGKNGELTIDKRSTITAVGGDAQLNGDPEHAGCQFRPSNAVHKNKSARYLIPAGKDPRKERDLPWAAMTYKIEDRDYFVQHLSHPSLPKGNRYSAYRDYGRFGSYPSVKIAKGDSFTFRFRFHINPGGFPEGAEAIMNERFKTFAATE